MRAVSNKRSISFFYLFYIEILNEVGEGVKGKENYDTRRADGSGKRLNNVPIRPTGFSKSSATPQSAGWLFLR
jgi:hypothetical protein